MSIQRLPFVNFLIILCDLVHSSANCDMTTTARVREGNLRQSGVFNWLGVLKVHLHDGDKWQVAVSGIVLIHVKYALANADDVVRVPLSVLQSDSLAVFLAADDTPWTVTPLSYSTHPEYEYATFNTIAVVELNTEDAEDVPLNPICFPRASFNTSGFLYLTGYTDENQVLEKVIYKIHYLDKQVCEEFYNRAGLSASKHAPTSYVCGYAPYNSSHCVWDNGMALVSNATGWFTLIGFGVRGPGCAAPARFIDMFQYFPWIKSVTSTNVDMYDSVEDFRRKDKNDEFVPIHDLFLRNNTRKQYFTPDVNVVGHEYIKYPFDVEKPRHFKIEPTEEEHTLAIYPFHEMHEQSRGACSSPRVLMYQERFKLQARQGTSGVATYKVQCENRTEAVLSFKEVIDFSEGTMSTESGETPEEVFKFFPIIERTAPTTGTTPAWQPDLRLHVPTFIKSDVKSGTVLNYDLYIKFQFKDWAFMKFQLFASPEKPPPPDTLRQGPKARARTTTSRPIPSLNSSDVAEPDKLFKEPEISIMNVHEEVFNTVSGVFCSRSISVYLLVGCLLTGVAFRKAFA